MTDTYAKNDNVAIITLRNPPVNALSYPMRVEVMAALRKAQADTSIDAIVLVGDGKAFCGGADINEFDKPEAGAEPTAWTLISALEQSDKPVVAAIHAVCMGGGFEVALGCHYRVAATGTQFAFPEVRLGLLPGAGGTQRLPRALDVESALNMIVSGKSIPAELLNALPGQKLLDKLSASNETLLQDAIAVAKEAAIQVKEQGEPPKLRNQPARHPQREAFFGFFRTSVSAAFPKSEAAQLCITCVEAATTKSFDEGMIEERKHFMSLLASPDFRGLKHVFLAEKAAGKLTLSGTGEAKPTLRKIEQIAVIGAGLMGGGIAMNFLNAGIPVTILELTQDALDKGVAKIRSTYESQVAKRKLTPEKLSARMALLKPSLSYADISQADLIIEAVIEDMGVKEKVFKQIDEVAKSGAILASNTSTLDLNKIAAFTKRPADVVGLHFFSPAHVMTLLEVVRGEQTSDAVMATVMALAPKIRKTAVVSGVCDGFIGNRMINALIRQTGHLIDEGASPQQIDQAMEKFGMHMGPFRVGDMAGNDVGWLIKQRHAVERPDLRYSKISDRLYKLGRHGMKAGAGWYDYVPGRRDPIVSEVMAAEIEAHRAEINVTPRKISSKEIVERLVYALVNEGARILEEGIATRASDIDIIYILGYGFPAWRGGPMHYANEVGLNEVLATIKRFQANPLAEPEFWKPAASLQALADGFKKFGDA